jgi:hypothetical protein
MEKLIKFHLGLFGLIHDEALLSLLHQGFTIEVHRDAPEFASHSRDLFPTPNFSESNFSNYSISELKPSVFALFDSQVWTGARYVPVKGVRVLLANDSKIGDTFYGAPVVRFIECL